MTRKCEKHEITFETILWAMLRTKKWNFSSSKSRENHFMPFSLHGEFPDLPYKVLENRRKCRSRYLWYKNKSEVEIWIYWLSFEKTIFFCFWWGLLKLGLMTSSVWLIKFDLKKVKFRPGNYKSGKENKHPGRYLGETADLRKVHKLMKILK